MIDLEQWERQQRFANRYASDRAMYRLGQRYGWPVPHPAHASALRAQRAVADTILRPFQRVAERFLEFYIALGGTFEQPAATLNAAATTADRTKR